MVWRVPKSGVTHEPVSKIEEQFESLMRSKQASTYQADYIQTPFEGQHYAHTTDDYC